MKHINRVLIFFTTLLLVSCYNKTDAPSRKNLIPSGDLVEILSEVHLAGGILNLPGVNRRFAFKDSVDNYIDIIDRYGFTKEQMDNTMKYYFVRKPKQLQEIYDQVLIRLNELETTVDAELPKPAASIQNLWDGRLTYSLPEDGMKESAWFDIPVQDTATYIIKATILVYADDQSLDPAINIFFWKADGSETGSRDYWGSIKLPKDGIPHDYVLSRKLTDTTYTRIRGWLVEHNEQSGTWEKHMKIESISVTRE